MGAKTGRAALAALCMMAALPAAAQQGQYDGTYEYAAAGWRGTLKVSTADDGSTYFAVATSRSGLNCNLTATGRLSGNTITLRGGEAAAAGLILRFFDDNAEIEAAGNTAAFCEPGAQLAGIYLHVSDDVTFDRDDIRGAQDRLNKLGYAAGGVDGLMGERTRTALRAFQRDAGLPATGALSLETISRLGQRLDEATTGAAARVGTGAAVGTGPSGGTDAADATAGLEWMTAVPRSWIPVLDRLYSGEVPARIDWSNPPFELAVRDLDAQPGTGGNREELLVFWNDVNFCGDQGCTFEVLRYRNDAYVPVLQTVAREIRLGADFDEGMRRIITDGEPWTWNGESYVQQVYQPQRVR